MLDYKNTDFYALFDVTIDASESEIRSAYRKQALKCHPDKTSDPEAIKKFQLLSEALKVLVDKDARAAYDKVWKLKRNQAAKRRQLDSKRQKLKDDLEMKEKKAQEEYASEYAQKMMEKEIERLKKEGSKILEKEIEKMRQEFECELRKQKEPVNPRLKVKPKTKNEKLSEDEVNNIFGKYGKLLGVVVGKKGTALLEYSSTEAAVNAYNGECQQFTIEWIQGKPSFEVFMQSNKVNRSRNDDFEDTVLRKLQEKEEQKRQVAKMEAKEGEFLQ